MLFEVTKHTEKKEDVKFDEGYMSRYRQNIIRDAYKPFDHCQYTIHFLDDDHKEQSFLLDIEQDKEKEEMVRMIDQAFVEYCLTNGYPLNTISGVDCEPVFSDLTIEG